MRLSTPAQAAGLLRLHDGVLQRHLLCERDGFGRPPHPQGEVTEVLYGVAVHIGPQNVVHASTDAEGIFASFRATGARRSPCPAKPLQTSGTGLIHGGR